MKGYTERVAARYDDLFPFDSKAEAAVDMLRELAGYAGRALEFGVGTGRIAVPLAARGVEVWGIDNSQPMLDVLATKADQGKVHGVAGDITAIRLGEQFNVVYFPLATISSLTTQQAQLDCFRTAAAHLRPGGAFVLEALVPDPTLPPGGLPALTETATENTLVLKSGWHDVVAQTVLRHTVKVVDGELKTANHLTRYVYPSELDLMAQVAGMQLKRRTADYRGAPFVPGLAREHVSVYEVPAS
jgi:ubiquinone/menaquinone biosynthesis C-methylase UbiE